MSNHKNWYAVITADVLWNDKLTPRQKLLCGMIANLSNERGYCFAGNKVFMEALSISERTMQRDLNTLVDGGYIARHILYKPGTKEIDKRILMPVGVPRNQAPTFEDIAENDTTPPVTGDTTPPVTDDAVNIQVVKTPKRAHTREEEIEGTTSTPKKEKSEPPAQKEKYEPQEITEEELGQIPQRGLPELTPDAIKETIEELKRYSLEADEQTVKLTYAQLKAHMANAITRPVTNLPARLVQWLLEDEKRRGILSGSKRFSKPGWSGNTYRGSQLPQHPIEQPTRPNERPLRWDDEGNLID